MLNSLVVEAHAADLAAQAKAGEITPEEVGDVWLSYADRNHAAGVAFLNAYDAAGGPR